MVYNILYIGCDSKGSTSLYRAEALKRLGHKVIICNPNNAAPKMLNHFFGGRLHYRTSYRFVQKHICHWLNSILSKEREMNLVWVDSGELIGVDAIKIIRKRGLPVVLYNHDDPTGRRDGSRFRTLQKAIPFYDLCVAVRGINVPEFYELGAKKVLLVSRSYDEVVHKPFLFDSEIDDMFKSEVSFIGTWMRGEDRDVFLVNLIKHGIPISIWGNRWEKSKYFSIIKPFYKGPALDGRDYVAAIQGAKICLGMLSKGNRDLCTTRTFEIPYAGGLFCAERTEEHLDLYKDFEEAVFWDNADECVLLCKKLLEDNDLRENIRLSGMRRVRNLSVGNEDICKKILNKLMEP